MAEKFDLSVILNFIDKSAKGLKGFLTNMSKIGKKMQSIGKTMSVAITAPIVGLGVNAIRIGSSFQNTMNMVGAVTQTTGKTFDALKMSARDLGATTQFSARQAGEAMRFMGMAGFDANKIIAASPKVLELAAAAQLDMGAAADLTTNIMSGFSFQAKDMTRVNDILVNTFTNANVSLPQMGEALKKVGPIASKMKFRFTEVSAALGLMGNAGIQGAEAGVAMRRALINLQKPTKQQQEAMRFMELEFKNADGTMKDLTGIVGEYEKAIEKGASETQVMTSMMEIFGPRAVAPMLALLSAGSKGLKEMEEKTKKVGTASEISRRQMEGLPGVLKLLKSAWEALNIALIEGAFGKVVEDFTRSLASLVSGIAKFIKTHPAITKWGLAIAGVAAIAGPLLILVGTVFTAVAAMAALPAVLALVGITVGAILLPIIGVTAAIVGLIALGALIILKWEPIKAWFKKFWENLPKLVNDAIEVMKNLFLNWTPLGQIIKNWKPIIEFFKKTFQIINDLVPDVVKDFLIGDLGTAIQKPDADKRLFGSDDFGSDDFGSDDFGTGDLDLSSINSQTEVIIKVESDNGSVATIQGVKQKGLANVKVENKSAVGPTIFNMATQMGFN